MSLELILQIAVLLLGTWFTYIGAKTVFSKKYYMTKVEETNGKSIELAYKDLPKWRIMFTRFSIGGQWLVFGLGLLALFVYSLFK